MTNLAKKPPLGLKVKEAKKDKKFLHWVRSQKCVICQTFHEVQLSPTQAHHPIHDRFSTTKVSDKKCIPLCEGHHQGLFDTSKTAIHRDPKLWREKYGSDYDFSM